MFKSCLESGKFPLEWRKGNVAPAHKKAVSKYWKITISYLCFPLPEKYLQEYCKIMFELFRKNHLISHNRSGSKPGDSCINQLLLITHEIYKLFYNGLDVRGVFLDISKAFGKVWQKGLIYKLKQNCISGNLLHTIPDFLNSRKQRVVLNGQFSSWTSTKAVVPQGSILGPLLF